MVKTLKIHNDTHSRLCNIGKKKETFDYIINKLLDMYEAKK
jgi:hypothetical protein